jgi:hypothetical protein
MDKLFYDYLQLSEQLLVKTYLPGLQKIINRASTDSWLMKNLKKRSDMVRGTKANILFMPRQDWGWRPVHPGTGVFPSGGKVHLAEMGFRLAMHGAGIQINLEELANLGPDNPEGLIDLMGTKMDPIAEGFPTYLQLMVRTPQSGIVLVASAAESSLGVAVDNYGLPNTVTGQRLKWLEEGMYLQWYRGVRTKVGEPVPITYLDHDNNVVYLAESRAVADNDFAVVTTIDGDEDMFYIGGTGTGNEQEMSPGIYDVLDDDNDFQGIDRSLAVNNWARAVVTNMSGAVPTKATLRKFLRDTKATVATTSPEVLDYLYDQLFASKQQWVNTEEFKYGWRSIKFQNVDIVGVPDGLSDSIDVVDFNEVFIAQKGGIEDPFGKGWYELPKSTKQCRDFCWWGRLVARKVSKSNGRYHNFIISNTIG